MKTTIALSAAVLMAISAPAFAGAHTQGIEARTMGKALKADPGSARIASTLRPGTENGEKFGVGGWGNIGSALVPAEDGSDDGVISPADPKGLTSE